MAKTDPVVFKPIESTNLGQIPISNVEKFRIGTTLNNYSQVVETLAATTTTGGFKQNAWQDFFLDNFYAYYDNGASVSTGVYSYLEFILPFAQTPDIISISYAFALIAAATSVPRPSTWAECSIQTSNDEVNWYTMKTFRVDGIGGVEKRTEFSGNITGVKCKYIRLIVNLQGNATANSYEEIYLFNISAIG